jgi:citronellol/citronellal dehydrogenase
VVAARRAEPLRAPAEHLGFRSSWVVCDVREAGDAARIVDAACGRHGRLDVLVNSAGGQYLAPVEERAGRR